MRPLHPLREASEAGLLKEFGRGAYNDSRGKWVELAEALPTYPKILPFLRFIH
jgi:hypothetical protein